MGLLSVKKLKPGMVLEKDVLNPEGKMLLSSGCQLAEIHIKRLREWGVMQVHVKGVHQSESGVKESNHQPDSTIIDAVEKKFKPHEGNSLMMGIKEVVKDFIRSRSRKT
jgi:hypothetical protein